MARHKFEVILEKVERIFVAVEAEDVEHAGLVAKDMESMGNANSIEDYDMKVLKVTAIDRIRKPQTTKFYGID